MPNQTDIWNAAADILKTKISTPSYDIFIKNIVPVRFDNTKLILKAADSYHKPFLMIRLKEEIKESLAEVLGFEIEFDVICDDDNKTDIEKEKEPTFKVSSDSDFYTFDNFMVGDSNRYAFSVCQAAAENPGKVYNPLFIYGGTGLGKTHLLKAIKNHIEKNNPSYTCLYISSETYTNEFIESLRNHTTHEFKKKYRNVDVLLLDDVQFFAGKDSTQDEFFHTYNELKDGNKQIILASDRPPKDIHPLEERLCGRFESGMLTSIEYPELELRVAIVKNKAMYYNVNLSDEVAYFIAETIKNNIRKIEGVINKVKAHQFIKGASPSVSSVKTMIRDISDENEPVPVLIDKIISEVSRFYNVKTEDIKSKRRVEYIKNARHISIYIVKELTVLSLTEIGSYFSMDHSSIHHAVSSVNQKAEKDKKLRIEIDEIIRNVKDM